MNKINVYSKVCLPCVDKKLWNEFQKTVWAEGYDLHVIRTTYSYEYHKEATELWGNEGYTAFVVAPNGEALNIAEAKKMFEGIRDKKVSAGKTKPVRKGKKNVQGLRKTKRSIRVASVENTPGEAEVEIKTR